MGRKGWGWDLHLGLADPNPGLLLKSDLPPKKERVLLQPNSFGLFLILFVCFLPTKCLYWTPVVETSVTWTTQVDAVRPPWPAQLPPSDTHGFILAFSSLGL